MIEHLVEVRVSCNNDEHSDLFTAWPVKLTAEQATELYELLKYEVNEYLEKRQ